MFDWMVEKHKTNKTWAMDVYIKYLAPVFVVFQLWQEQWVSALGIIAVVAFMFPMRQVARLQGRVSKEDAGKIALGFSKWLEKQPARDMGEQFDIWWDGKNQQ